MASCGVRVCVMNICYSGHVKYFSDWLIDWLIDDMCVRVSRSWILSKRINRSSKNFHRRVAKPFQFFCTKRDGNISTGIPITGSSNAVRVGTNRDRRRYGWLSIDDVMYLRTTSVTIHSLAYRTDGDVSVKLYYFIRACSMHDHDQENRTFICTQR